MTDKWFDEFVFQIVIKKDFLSLEERNIINSEPRLIEPWDPLGTLA